MGLLVVAGPATGQLNTRFAWGPGQRMFCAVGDPWSTRESRSAVWYGDPVRRTRLVRSLGVILRRWGGPARSVCG